MIRFSSKIALLCLVTMSHLLSGQVDRELNDLEGEAYFEKANALIEEYMSYAPQKSEILLKRVLANEALEDYPEEQAKALLSMGEVFIVQGEFKQALDHIENAIALFDQEGLAKYLGRSLLKKAIASSYMGNYDEARMTLIRSKEVFEKEGDALGIASVYHEQGHLHYQQAEDRQALEFYRKSLDLYEEQANAKGISDNYFRMALAYLGIGNREKALDYLVQAKELKEKIRDHRGLAKVKISLGVMHEEMGNAETAIKYYLESYEANKTIGDKRINSILFNNLGVAYTDGKQYDSALIYHKKALDLRRELGKEQGIVQSLMNIGEIHNDKRDSRSALSNLREAYELSHKSETKPMLGGVTGRLGEVFLDLGQWDSAATYFNEQLQVQKKGSNYFNLANTYANLSKVKEKQGDFKRSLEYHKLFKKIRDSSLLVRGAKELAEVEAKYENEKKQAEIVALQQENEKRTLWRNIFAFGALLALIATVLLIQFFRYRNKKNRELLATQAIQHKQLKELDRMKSRFFSNISHEFRTPLTLILGPLNELRRGSTPAMHPQLNMIERNGKRLLKLINQLLDLSKIESGKITLKATLIDVVPLIKGLTMSFDSVAKTKNIGLSFTSDQDSQFVYVDSEKIEQVIINLLSNAFKYTPNGGQIQVSLTQQSKEKHITLSVSDTGSGIPEQEIPYIFDRFYQASNAENEEVTGTGIGLALIKELVELHKGKIKAQSEMGKGSTFMVSLPMGREHLKDEEISGIRQTQQETSPQDLLRNEDQVPVSEEDASADEKPLVLVIEDNADLRAYIKDILKNSFHSIDAVNGKEGVAMAKERIPDIIISDLMMPKMDGLEVCRYLKEEMLTSHIPIILLTAKSSKEDRLEGLKSLADDYLTKPFDTDELLIRLNNLITLRQKIQAKFNAHDMLTPKKIEMSSLDAVFMEKVTEQLEKEMANALFGVVELAYAVGLSRSQLFRKVKAITNLTPNEYIRSFRLHRAMDILRQEGANVSQAAYETGFQNPSYFSKCFQEQFGMAPSSVLKQKRLRK